MKCLLIAATAVLGFVGIVCAQAPTGTSEPFEGTWMLNVAKSTFAEVVPPKARTLIIERNGSDFLYRIETTNTDGSSARIAYMVPVQGGKGRVLEGPYDDVVHRRIDAYTREAEYLKGGRTVVAFTGRVSDDRRLLRIIVKNDDRQGRQTETVTLYERR
jgi:hypothetical protein